jgi:uncharacterized protein YegP (UPF0339 family)
VKTDGKVIVYRSLNQDWRWQITARNGRIVGASSEGYRDRKRAFENLRLVTSVRIIVPPNERRAQRFERPFSLGFRS